MYIQHRYVDTWTPENSESCGLVSTSEKLTIKGRGFYSATDDVIEVTFDSTIVNASVVNSTYSHIVISFSELSAVSSGNLSATVSVPSSKCWTDSCYGVCLNNVSDYINNLNVAAESCANINMVSSCTFQCNDEYNASTASMCLRTGDWENTTAQCLRQCDTISNPTNGVLVNCVAPLSSGSTCDITCDSGYSADGMWWCWRENLNHISHFHVSTPSRTQVLLCVRTEFLTHRHVKQTVTHRCSQHPRTEPKVTVLTKI